ncbi:hypothetical protein BCR32DRAFT_293177 [Anaeromyces robustus]|uniref:Ankyrin n=1 Tax=Anaeromyces robustus TaxID=1754192 RepID=A0A1Y1X8A9_9FUNG|nr:hypothetical protein BCR32DRAFT_293177 [Anaeromyces robustus]|eukprot:ORX81584.1 hypothetical protein BCR32DRAFT_293177 [Anaeromyces robustus]
MYSNIFRELYDLVLNGNLTNEENNVFRLITDDNVSELDKYLGRNNISLKQINSSGDKTGFDVLILALKTKASLDMIKYIVNKTPYKDLNYGLVKDKNNFEVPLFIAIANNDFQVADYLISKGASLEYNFKSEPWNTGTDYVNINKSNNLPYYSMEGQGLDLDYYYNINANLLDYLREYKRLNKHNKKYIENKGLRVDINLHEKKADDYRERLIKKYMMN